MKRATITLDGNAQQVSAFAVGIPHQVRWISISNPSGNSTLFVGNEGGQTYPIVADKNQLFPEHNLKNIWVKGTNLDVIELLYA